MSFKYSYSSKFISFILVIFVIISFSTDTITAVKVDSSTTTKLFSFKSDGSLESIGVTEEYFDRASAQKQYDIISKDTKKFANISINSKTLSYTFTDSEISIFSDKSQDDIVKELKDNGYTIQ